MTRANKPSALKPSRTRAKALPAAQAAPKATSAEPPHGEAIVAENGSAAAPKGKLGVLVSLLTHAPGATIADMATATGWQAHSVRGALAGALKKRGYAISSEKSEGARVYRIAQ